MKLLLLLSALIFTNCASSQNQKDYPAHWWQTVARDANTPSWEILPQEAIFPEVIVSKRHELGLLSNFAPTPFIFKGKKYASMEGFWQAMKYPENDSDPRAKNAEIKWPYTRSEVEQLTAFKAKFAGDFGEKAMPMLGIDWVSFEGKHFIYRTPDKGEHYKLIRAAMWEKVKQNPEVKKVLLATHGLTLKPDHHEEANASPAWKYCKIWMEIRERLEQGYDHD